MAPIIVVLYQNDANYHETFVPLTTEAEPPKEIWQIQFILHV